MKDYLIKLTAEQTLPGQLAKKCSLKAIQGDFTGIWTTGKICLIQHNIILRNHMIVLHNIIIP